ncbi:TPA: Ig-like domain-containing protein [Photobacterium damselae]
MISRVNNMKKFAIPLFVIIPTILVGCGGDSSSGSDNIVDKPLAPAPVLNSFIEKVKTGGERNIDFSNAIYRPDLSQTYSLDNVTVETGNCTVAPVSDFVYAVNAADDGLCNLKYTVSNSDNVSASSDATVVASSSLLTTYPMIAGINASVGTPIEIDILDELAKNGIDTSGLIIDPNIYTTGVGRSSVDELKQIIQFDGTDGTADEKFGVASIIYALKDKSTGSVDGYGRIDIAVSSDFNTAPKSELYLYPEILKANVSGTSLKYYINLRDLRYTDGSPIVDPKGKQKHIISDPDNPLDHPDDNLQLLKVSNYGRKAVTITNPDKLDNLEFTFEPYVSESNIIDVSYVVTDHDGGYTTNIIRFKVRSPSSLFPWEDIYTFGKRFFAPITKELSDLSFFPIPDFDVEDDIISGKDYNIALMDHELARKYCTVRGARLPRLDEINSLMVTGDLHSNKFWPDNQLYWSDEEKGFNANDGTIISLMPSEKIYTTCVVGGINSINITNTAKCNGTDTNTLSLSLSDEYGQPLVGQAVAFMAMTDPSVAFDGQVFTITKNTDLNGSLSVAVSTAGTSPTDGCRPTITIMNTPEIITVESEFQP